MKKLFLILFILLLSPFAAVIQAKSLSEQCENIAGVNTVDIDQAMLKLAVFPPNEGPIKLSLISDKLDRVQIITTITSGPARNEVMELTDKYLETTPRFKRAMRTKDDTTLLMLYSRELEKNQNEFLLVVEDQSNLTIVLLSGEITMEEIGSVTSF